MWQTNLVILAALKVLTFGACGYEAIAGFTRRFPTISMLCERRRLLVPLVLGGLALHLYQKELNALLDQVRSQVPDRPRWGGSRSYQSGPALWHDSQVGGCDCHRRRSRGRVGSA